MYSEPLIRRPIRLAGLIAAPFAGGCLLVAPSVPFSHPLSFAIAGLGYTVMLSAIAVGILLTLPSRLFSWWIFGTLIPLVAMMGVWSTIPAGTDGAFSNRFDVFTRVAQVASFTWLGGAVLLAGFGWWRFLKGERGSRPDPPAD